MITYLPWYVELWIAFTLGTLILLLGIWVNEVLNGRYDPTIFDLEGDDEKLRDHIVISPPEGKFRKQSIYDLIDDNE
jgi:type IV secretory pathway TrbD component